jgi:phospholipid N-methyltransferase
MPLKTITSLAKFSGEFISNPGPVGSLIPSGRSLGKRMASLVPSVPAGCVVELGAGTGAITAALLARGIAPEKLILVDSSPAMIRTLHKQFPQLKVIAGSAARLKDLLDEHLDSSTGPVSHIVSGLPLRSLPKNEVSQIVRETKKVLQYGGQLIQFTYDLRNAADPALKEFELESSSIVWMNVPPARVKVYEVEPSNEISPERPLVNRDPVMVG